MYVDPLDNVIADLESNKILSQQKERQYLARIMQLLDGQQGFTPMGSNGTPMLPYASDDHTVANKTFHGFYDKSDVPTNGGEAKFAILVEDATGGFPIYGWADGNQSADNIWNNRAALTYTLLS